MSKKMNEVLAKISNGESDSYWIEHVKYVVENRAWLRKSAIIAMRVLDALDAQKLSQKDLAERMGVSPQQISKIVKGHENLTLETITKLEAALSVQLILETANPKEWVEEENEWVAKEKESEWNGKEKKVEKGAKEKENGLGRREQENEQGGKDKKTKPEKKDKDEKPK